MGQEAELVATRHWTPEISSRQATAPARQLEQCRPDLRALVGLGLRIGDAGETHVNRVCAGLGNAPSQAPRGTSWKAVAPQTS